MSYMSLPNITFSGRFQADTSTINNNVRYFNNDTFKPEYQRKQPNTDDYKTAVNGYWNPDGSGAFRLIDTKVKRARVATNDDGKSDPICGLFLNAQEARTSAKLVDLDPQWQFGSIIFGLRLVLTDGTRDYMRCAYRPAPFRDIFFKRKPTGKGSYGSETASAKFTSILTNVTFTEHAANSPTLMALKKTAEGNGNCLAVNLMTAVFDKDTTFGMICGAIGPWQSGDPFSFVAGRRFGVDGAASLGAPPGMYNQFRVGYADAVLAGGLLTADLSNALPLQLNNQIRDIGDLSFAVLNVRDIVQGLDTETPEVTVKLQTGHTVKASDITLLGEIPYRDVDWLWGGESGLVRLTLTQAQADLAASAPLAIVRPDGDQFQIVSRETAGGLFARADEFEFRMDPTKTSPATAVSRVLALQYGRPLPGAPLTTSRQVRKDGGGSFEKPACVVVPDVNFPREKIKVTRFQWAGPDGWAEFVIEASDPGNPRGFVDGQIFEFLYGYPVTTSFSAPIFEMIVAHVRNAVDVPKDPDWDTDIAPFMQQYDNLYPIMSKCLFSLADPEVAAAHAKILAFAFERPFSDPNHMPVTRDMSTGKRQIILNWLSQHTGEPPAQIMVPAAVAGKIDDTAGPTLPERPLEDWIAIQDALPLEDDGKSRAAREYAQRQIDALKGGAA